MKIPRPSQKAVTLTELLVVLVLIVSLIVLSAPAFTSIGGASRVNRAIGDLSDNIELARMHALANRTYVRLAFAEIDESIVVVLLYSVDGTSVGDMADAGNWRALRGPVVLERFCLNDSLGQESDDLPSASSKPVWSTEVGMNSQDLPGGESGFHPDSQRG